MRCKLAKGQVTGNREMSICKALLTSTLFLSIISTHLENILQCGISCFNLSRRDISSFFFFVLFFVLFFILLPLLPVFGFSIWFGFQKCLVFCLKKPSSAPFIFFKPLALTFSDVLSFAKLSNNLSNRLNQCSFLPAIIEPIPDFSRNLFQSAHSIWHPQLY